MMKLNQKTVDALVVIVTGIALVAAVVMQQKEISFALGGGLIGYLGHGIQADADRE